MTVTFETKVWEQDWELVLRTDRLERVVAACGPSVTRRVLAINNVEDRTKVARAADRAIGRGTIDEYFFVADTAEEALRHFGLTREALGKGYYYSIAELAGLYRARTEYLLHFAGDSAPASNDSTWLPACLRVMAERPDIAVCNLSWTKRMDSVARESSSVDEDFYFGFGFSDQMYLVRTEQFRQPIYGETHEASGRYPKYGGESFEKRVDSWMRNHGLLRATYRHANYVHANFTRSPLAKRLSVFAGNPYLTAPLDRLIRKWHGRK
jgi:hypothetical protein